MSDPLTVAELVAASEGQEGAFLVILRSATEQIEDRLRQRALSVVQEAAAAGIELGDLASAFKATSTAPEAKTRAKPVAPADDAELLKLLLAELDKGATLTAKALARRTGATTERAATVLRRAQEKELGGSIPDAHRIKLNGLKWSRKAAQ